MYFAFNFPLEKIIVGLFAYNLGQRKWIFLLIIWDGESINQCPRGTS